MATDTVGPHPTITHLHTPPCCWRTCSSGRRSRVPRRRTAGPAQGPQGRGPLSAACAGPPSRSAASTHRRRPYRRPTAPRGVVVPPSKPTLGADYETDWARRRPAASPARSSSTVRCGWPSRPWPPRSRRHRPPGRPASPHDEEARRPARRHLHPQPPQPPRHTSRITAIPEPWRGHLVVGAAADYFFTTHVTSAASALVLNAFPVARTSPVAKPRTWPGT